MNEKRFTIHKESKYKEEWYAYPFCIKEDGEIVLERIPLSIAEKVRDKLNEQQSIIRRDEMSIKTMMSNMEKLEEENEQLRQFINKGRRLSVKELMNNMNENELLKKKIKRLEKDNEELKDRLYDFEKRKIIEDEINEDVIPKIKLLRTELFGENYE